MNLKKIITVTLVMVLALPALATRPKIGKGFGPGLNDGAGNTTGAGTTEISMPIGVAVDGTDGKSLASNSDKSDANIVYTVDLGNETGAASVNQTHSALEKARSMNAACVLIRINSFAGGWDDAENIRQEIRDFEKPVMIVVNDNAGSASAFVSGGKDSVFKSGKSTVITNRKAAAIHSRNVNAQRNIAVIPQVENQDLTPSAHESEEVVLGDETMHEVLYRAGLSNLTVVHHAPGIAERIADVLVQPWVSVLILLLAGFVFSYASRKSLPGPALYLLFIISALYIAPFHYAGLMNTVELIGALTSIILLVSSLKMNLMWLRIVSFGLMSLFFALSQMKDSGSITTILTSVQILYTLALCSVPVAAGLISEMALQRLRSKRVHAGK
ncbi:MAG: hypothetical protein L6Q81_08440 [Bacteroidia bacterium]|nr:hypothetical protein [Bacteroidia bacterium]